MVEDWQADLELFCRIDGNRGSFDDLIARYYRLSDFLDPGDRTRLVYRGVIERWRPKYGKGMVRDLQAKHVEAMMAEMLPHRRAANMLRKRLNALMRFAIQPGIATTRPSDQAL
ncbi:MAG: hypothetical protein PSY12_16930 [bacterium]|nr:hypothetical protein [bacterium]